jgi:pyruvate/2-oxoglutarate dehydrogenase complex dihydrolipoamide dehydrogenase (E3) component
MALTPIPALTFYWVSQLGMLAGTAVYVNAGTRLAQIDSLSGLLSTPLLVSFAALGLFPWLARAAVAVVRRRRLYRDWPKPATFDRNLIVIGAGSAGLVSAYIAAAAKAKVTLVERDRMGGDCLNTGCVPSKALIRSAGLAHRIAHADRYGLAAMRPEVPFDQVMERIHGIIASIAPHDSPERYRSLGVDVRLGEARLINPWTVEILTAEGPSRLTARAIVLATGAAPVLPPLPGLETVAPMTSDTIWDRLRGRPHPPGRLVVLGGGPIGSELAQAFARLGSGVVQIERGDRLLSREDEEVSRIARAALEADGVEVLTGTTALAFGSDDSGKWVEVAAAGTDAPRRRIPFDEVLVAVGRKPRLTGFGLEALGIDTAPEGPFADGFLRTKFPNILAAGDVAGPYQFTHVASHQAWFAAVNGMLAGLWRLRADYRVIPRGTFIDPEVATVGLTEAQATEDGTPFEVSRFAFAELDRAIADSETTGFVKVLTAPGKDRILGVTIVGAEAAELLAEYVLAMKHGLGLGKILGTIHTYPTLAEANKSAAGEWRRAHLSPRLLAWAERFHDWRRG